MKVILLVTTAGFSFSHQAVYLQAAAATAGIETTLAKVSNSPSDIVYDGDLVVPIGSWQDFDRIIRPALSVGKRVLPWIVSDDNVSAEAASALNFLPFFLTTSEHCKSIFARDRVRAEKIGVLPECVDEDVWRPQDPATIKWVVDLLSIDGDDSIRSKGTPILFTTGGDATSKGALEIIQALGTLDRSIAWVYIIKTWPSAGSFKRSAAELEAASKYGITDRIKYVSGEFSDRLLIGLMNLCDIYIATSRGEGFGLPLVEAQLCGKPVITHNATATQETVVDNQSGLIATSHLVDGHPQAVIADLADKLRLVLTDRALRERLSRQARPTAVGRFGKKVIGQQFATFVKEFLA